MNPSDIEIAEEPIRWLVVFPVGLLALSLTAFLVAISWPPYIMYRLIKYAYYILSEK